MNASELAERFNKALLGREEVHGVFHIASKQKNGKKVEGKGRTQWGSVTPELWKKHLTGEIQLGILPIRVDNTCYWGAIDIDSYDIDLSALERKVKEATLPLTVCRTKSGGAHLYLALKEATPAAVVRRKLGDWAVALGYPGVEIFPKQDELAGEDDVGNWLNMPYCGTLGDEECLRYAIEDGEPLGPTGFVDALKARSIDQETLEAIQPVGGPISDGPPCLQSMALHGVPEGGRNEALFNFGIYAKLAYGDQWEDQLSRYNREVLDSPLGVQEVADLAKSLRKKEYVYRCNEQPLCSFCNKDVCRSRTYGIAASAGPDKPDVMIGAIEQLRTDPPVWFVTVNGVRVRMTTDDLMNQYRFAKRCIEEIRYCPQRIKDRAWQEFLNERLQYTDVIEAPEDSSAVGQFHLLFEGFVNRNWQARDWEDILRGMPYQPGDGNIYFRSTDLRQYLQSEGFRELSTKDLWAELRDLGADHLQKSIKGRTTKLWRVPEHSVKDPETEEEEEYQVPRTEGPEF